MLAPLRSVTTSVTHVQLLDIGSDTLRIVIIMYHDMGGQWLSRYADLRMGVC